MLFSNGFIKNFTDTYYIDHQLRKLFFPNPPSTSVRKAIVNFPLKYLGKRSFSLRNKLSKLMNEFYPQVTVRVIFKPKLTIQNFFKFKDRVPDKLQSSVVYKGEFWRDTFRDMQVVDLLAGNQATAWFFVASPKLHNSRIFLLVLATIQM